MPYIEKSILDALEMDAQTITLVHDDTGKMATELVKLIANFLMSSRANHMAKSSVDQTIVANIIDAS